MTKDTINENKLFIQHIYPKHDPIEQIKFVRIGTRSYRHLSGTKERKLGAQKLYWTYHGDYVCP